MLYKCLVYYFLFLSDKNCSLSLICRHQIVSINNILLTQIISIIFPPSYLQRQRGAVERGSVRVAADRAHARRLRRPRRRRHRLRYHVAVVAPLTALSQHRRRCAGQRGGRRTAAAQVRSPRRRSGAAHPRRAAGHR